MIKLSDPFVIFPLSKILVRSYKRVNTCVDKWLPAEDTLPGNIRAQLKAIIAVYLVVRSRRP